MSEAFLPPNPAGPTPPGHLGRLPVVITQVVDTASERVLQLEFRDGRGDPLTNASGNQLYEPVDVTKQASLGTLLNICVDLGPGNHDLSEVARVSGTMYPTALGHIDELAETLPDELFGREMFDGIILKAVRVGNIAMASRRATAEDLFASEWRQLQAEREAKDAGKVEFSRYDHAIVTVGERQFHLATDRANTILAARVLQVLADLPATTDVFEGQDVANRVWKAMTTSERLLFIAPQDPITDLGIAVRKGWGKSLPTNKYVRSVLRTLMSPLGVTRETTGDRFKLERRPTITFHSQPQAEEVDTTNLVPIFPPGTPIDEIKAVNSPISANAFEQADIILRDILPGDELLGQDVAIRLFNQITNSEIKRAIRARLARNAAVAGLDETLASLHERVAQSLRDSFEGAHRERMIAGYSKHGSHGGIHMTASRLLATTLVPQMPTATSKWRIGLRK